MGVRGHVEVTHPTYGKNTISSWIADKAKEYLTSKGFEVREYNDGDRWEIENTPSLMTEASYLAFDGDRFEAMLPKEMQGQDNAKSLGYILLEGMAACVKNGDSDVIIEWW